MIHNVFRFAGFTFATLLVGASLGNAVPLQPSQYHSYWRQGRLLTAAERPRRDSSVAQLAPSRSHVPTATLGGGWRLLQTPDPRGGREVVAVSHAVDLLRSDPDLAGIMLRCGGDAIDVLLVLVRPLSPRSHPQVTIKFETKTVRFDGAVVPPGVSIRLPLEAAALSSGPWQSIRELSVAIEDVEGGKINGVVPLEGLKNAYATLVAACKAN